MIPTHIYNDWRYCFRLVSRLWEFRLGQSYAMLVFGKVLFKGYSVIKRLKVSLALPGCNQQMNCDFVPSEYQQLRI